MCIEYTVYKVDCASGTFLTNSDIYNLTLTTLLISTSAIFMCKTYLGDCLFM